MTSFVHRLLDFAVQASFSTYTQPMSLEQRPITEDMYFHPKNTSQEAIQTRHAALSFYCRNMLYRLKDHDPYIVSFFDAMPSDFAPGCIVKEIYRISKILVEQHYDIPLNYISVHAHIPEVKRKLASMMSDVIIQKEIVPRICIGCEKDSKFSRQTLTDAYIVSLELL